MKKETVIEKLKDNTMTLDDFRSIAYEMPKETIADILVELAFSLYVECGSDENRANKALLAGLLERWWYELESEEN